jgi:isopentenyl diphosphate isomerase/L-lactate dehydrogenase-like FMN-dependent dehydrogenase
MSDRNEASRRRFLKFLVGSPLSRYVAIPGTVFGPRSVAWGADGPPAPSTGISSPAQALNVFDLEEVARKNLPPAHFAYLATGVEADATIRANREGFAKFQIRARRLVDTSRIDASVRLFGTAWPTPIVLAPVSSLRAFHPDGDIAVARAARARNHLQVLSTLATASVEDVIAARGAPVWFQLYPTTDWNITRALVKRAEAAGCPVVAITVDNPTSAGRETLARGRRLDSRDCSTCHSTEPGGAYRRKPMFDGIDTTKLTSTLTAHLTWDFVHRLQDITSMKIVLKGIVTAEDATLALSHGVNGLIVSNHGGRGEESARSTIEALPEVVEVIGGRIPVLVDSGFRRGTDIFKALALGANAVCVGRPYAWGLAAFGQAGVERSLEILNAELEITMRSMGTPTVQSITRAFVQHT